MYLDWSYFVLVLPAVLLALWASSNVNTTFRRYSGNTNRRGLTGAQAARAVLRANGVYDVRVDHVSGNLTDHFDPKENVIRLSDGVFSSTSTAAIGVACHEAGHAVQYHEEYFPIRIRAAVIPATNIGSKLALPLILAGVLLSGLSGRMYHLVYVGIACFALSLVFQLLTLPVEFNASNRALATITSTGMLTDQELVGAKKTLRAAALTYVAATAVALTQLLRLILLYGGNDRRRNR